jgi:hypothetical protein
MRQIACGLTRKSARYVVPLANRRVHDGVLVSAHLVHVLNVRRLSERVDSGEAARANV